MPRKPRPTTATGTLRDVHIESLVNGTWQVTAVYTLRCALCSSAGRDAMADGEHHWTDHEDHDEVVGGEGHSFADLGTVALALPAIDREIEVDL